MLTRQHFEGLAALVASLDLPDRLTDNSSADDRYGYQLRERLIRELCRWCRWQNARFDAERFRRACGGDR